MYKNLCTEHYYIDDNNHSESYNYNYTSNYCDDDYFNDDDDYIIDNDGDIYYSNGDILKANGDMIYYNDNLNQLNSICNLTGSWVTLNNINIKRCHLSDIICLIPNYNNLSDLESKRVLTNKIRHEFTNYDELIRTSNNEGHDSKFKTMRRNIIKCSCLLTIGQVYNPLLDYCKIEAVSILGTDFMRYVKSSSFLLI